MIVCIKFNFMAPTCYAHSFKGRDCLPRGRVLCLTLEGDRLKRVIHPYLHHVAPHGLIVHGRHVATRRQTCGGTHKRVPLRNFYHVGAFDLDLWWTSWKTDRDTIILLGICWSCKSSETLDLLITVMVRVAVANSPDTTFVALHTRALSFSWGVIEMTFPWPLTHGPLSIFQA